MKLRFYIKLALIFALIFALLIPQTFIEGLVSERAQWRQQAYNSIAESWSNEQILTPPILIVPYQLTTDSVEEVAVDKKIKKITKKVTTNGRLFLMSEQVRINSNLEGSSRYRGIYAVPVYNNKLQIAGAFNTQPLINFVAENANKKIQWQKPQLSVLVSDQRGIDAPPLLKWNNVDIAFKPAPNLSSQNDLNLSGMHAILPEIATDKVSTLNFSFDMNLRGMAAMNFALLSENTHIQLTSNWASPSFIGSLLPEKRDITEQGFTAEWQASSFSFNTHSDLEACANGACEKLMNHIVGFALIQPVDVYQQSERSIKYALLFISLTFIVLVLFELLKKLRIHPIQYTLVGMALLVFYLLLISLSEHLLFLTAYVISATASMTLLTCYFGAILHSRKLGMILGAALATLYAVLYVILQSEDNALLMGSVLIFVMLAGLMMATRHFDWYALTESNAAQEPKVAPELSQESL